MSDEDDDDDGLTALPATMSDILFSLVAVVIVVLLSLAPAIRTPGALASQKSDLLTSPILVESEPALVFVAEAAGLRIGQGEERLVPLDAILTDADLAQALRESNEEVLLLVADDGQEAAFLFNSLAGAHGIASIRQLRLDPKCRHIADPVRVGCTPSGAPA
ncbi:hypothetical protein PRN20_04740 [Devosia sp. ZB163]|uniref:hypothetical protein n=1 Tax=Devosia sp. ZB163 TaxID=3025938 RepID=UPI00235DE88E|nr:hypothetical protein [Devosia sp. ZB163]MDC9823030.1 hypothetical protein [Devosia sp. ZB163]